MVTLADPASRTTASTRRSVAAKRRRHEARWAFSLGPQVIAWIEANCVYPSGDKIGKPFRLLPWQRDWIVRLFTCDAAGGLRYRWALLGVPKKQGKSSMIAALGLYHLLADPYVTDPWVVVAAASGEQANIVFGHIKKMCELSAPIRDQVLIFQRQIRARQGHGLIERVAAAKGRLDGKNISLLLMDELHEWERENWTVLTNGTVGRERAQIIEITTAPYDEDSVCMEEYEKGRAIEAGEIDLPTFFFRWHSAPAEMDYRLEATWRAANPSYGVTVTRAALEDKLRNTKRGQFERYFLNRIVSAREVWLEPGQWEACRGEIGVWDANTTIYAAWDASTKYDSTALVVIAVLQEPTGQRRIEVRAWVWERPLDPFTADPIADWVVPIAEVREIITMLWRDHDLRAVAYDPMFVTWDAQDMEAEGITMIEWPQTNIRMCPATQAAYETIAKREIVHDGDPVLAKHVERADVVTVRSGGQRIVKAASGDKVDACVALVMAIGLLEKTEGAVAWEPQATVV